MKIISLTQGKVAIVDDDDYERLSNFSWCINGGYAARGYHKNGKVVIEKMHHAVIGKPPRGLVTDHINGNKLDNRKSNLRFITQQYNCFNSKKKKPLRYSQHFSHYKGVTWRNDRNKWRSSITINGKRVYLGLFSSEKEVAIAYNIAAQKYYGIYAKLNDFKEDK